MYQPGVSEHIPAGVTYLMSGHSISCLDVTVVTVSEWGEEGKVLVAVVGRGRCETRRQAKRLHKKFDDRREKRATR